MGADQNRLDALRWLAKDRAATLKATMRRLAKVLAAKDRLARSGARKDRGGLDLGACDLDR
jgi:hypothetical protein